MGTGSFPGVEAAGAWGWPRHPHLVPKVLEKNRAIPLLTLRACMAYKKGWKLTYLLLRMYISVCVCVPLRQVMALVLLILQTDMPSRMKWTDGWVPTSLSCWHGTSRTQWIAYWWAAIPATTVQGKRLLGLSYQRHKGDTLCAPVLFSC